MAASFEDKATIPDDNMLAGALGKSNRLWQEIRKHLKAEYEELIKEWIIPWPEVRLDTQDAARETQFVFLHST